MLVTFLLLLSFEVLCGMALFFTRVSMDELKLMADWISQDKSVSAIARLLVCVRECLRVFVVV